MQCLIHSHMIRIQFVTNGFLCAFIVSLIASVQLTNYRQIEFR